MQIITQTDTHPIGKKGLLIYYLAFIDGKVNGNKGMFFILGTGSLWYSIRISQVKFERRKGPYLIISYQLFVSSKNIADSIRGRTLADMGHSNQI